MTINYGRLCVANVNDHSVTPVGALNSTIVTEWPLIFARFREERIVLLYRGSRDGWQASDFHRTCDGHRNTLTIILDTTGNIFGGYTPIVWEGPVLSDADRQRGDRRDPSCQSFVFTLKNPSNSPGLIFALHPGHRAAVHCDYRYGPSFGSADFWVGENCQIQKANGTAFGRDYGKGSGFNETFLTGSANFSVQEIEVFEIAD
jgi:hypothetical protein